MPIPADTELKAPEKKDGPLIAEDVYQVEITDTPLKLPSTWARAKTCLSSSSPSLRKASTKGESCGRGALKCRQSHRRTERTRSFGRSHRRLRNTR